MDAEHVDGVVELIDGAVRDWETSPDAMRMNAPAPPAGVTPADVARWFDVPLELVEGIVLGQPRLEFIDDYDHNLLRVRATQTYWVPAVRSPESLVLVTGV